MAGGEEIRDIYSDKFQICACEEIANMYAPGFKFIKNTFPLTPPAA